MIRRVVHGFFCARHKLAIFVRSTDGSSWGHAFVGEHQRCGVVFNRWVIE